MAKEQLCWTCQKACGDCSWSRCFQPVKGWTAEKVHRKPYDSYQSKQSVPEYVPDKKSVGGIDLTIKELCERMAFESRERRTRRSTALELEQERALTNATSTVAQSGSERCRRQT